MSTNRIKYIDYTKAIGIIFIVFAHCIQWFPVLKTTNLFVISFHVPIFFIISGCLQENRKQARVPFLSFLAKKSKSLLLPYLYFSFINFFIKLTVLILFKHFDFQILKTELFELFITGNGTVWFLATLFWVHIFWFFLDKYLNNIPFLFIFAFVCLFVPYCLPSLQKYAFFIVIFRIIAGLGYFIVGYLLSIIIKKLSHTLLLSVFLLCIGILLFFVLGSSFSFFEGYFYNPIGSIGCSNAISIGIILLCLKFESLTKCFPKKSLDFLGKHSLEIMCIHPILLNCITFPFGNAFVQTGSLGAFYAIGLFAVILILSSVVSYFITTKAPWIFGKSNKKG